MLDFERMETLGVDREQAQKRFLGSKDFYHKCITIYFKTNDIARLERLCADQNWDKALDCAHTLKGSSGNMAFVSLFKIYSDMTEYFRSGDTEAALSLLPEAVELEKELREAAGYRNK